MKIATRIVLPLIILLALVDLSAPTFAKATVGEQPAGSLSIDTLMATPFPTDLVAAPVGGRIAWVSSNSGVHNILVAEPAPPSQFTMGNPDHKWRAVTSYKGDDGLWITDLNWTSDGKTIVYVRGDGANRQGESPNPAQLQDGTEQAVFAVSIDGGAPKKLGVGNGPVPSPRGQRVAWVSRGQIWSADLGTTEAAARLVNARGSASGLAWSPDGTMLAFTSGRGTHSYIGIFTLASRELRYIDPSLDRDGEVAWSPDGTRIAWIRQGAAPRARMFSPRRQVDEPWSLRVADVKTGQAKQVWKADAGYGSAFQGVVSDDQLYWAAGDRLVFPWEKNGWRLLYSVPAAGGKRDAADAGQLRGRVREHRARSDADDLQLEPGRHRSTARVDGAGRWIGAARPTAGEVERQRMAAGDHQRWTHGRHARRRPDAAARDGDLARTTTRTRCSRTCCRPGSIPAALVTPQAVTITATDGMRIPTQLFLPRDLKAGERRPALIFFHGGSRRQMLTTWHYNYYYRNAYAMNQWLASQGYIVLSVNYRSGIGYGLEFREALNYGASGGAEFNDVMGAGLYLKSRHRRRSGTHRLVGRIVRRLPHRDGPVARLGSVRRRRGLPRRARLEPGHPHVRARLQRARRSGFLATRLRSIAALHGRHLEIAGAVDPWRRRPQRVVHRVDQPDRRAAETQGRSRAAGAARRSPRLPAAPELGPRLQGDGGVLQPAAEERQGRH